MQENNEPIFGGFAFPAMTPESVPPIQAQNPVPVQQAAPQQVPPQPAAQRPAPNNNLPNGRFNGAPVRTPEHQTALLQPNGCRIVNLQVTKGVKTRQTLVTLENARGKQLTGYI